MFRVLVVSTLVFLLAASEDLVRWHSYGAGTVCRLDASDESSNGRGSAEALSPISSLRHCQRECEGADLCTGIEYQKDLGKCYIWTEPIGYHRQGSHEEECLSYKYPTTPTTTTSSSWTLNAPFWQTFGPNTACSLNESDTTMDGQGSTQLLKSVDSITSCKDNCLNNPMCKGIEYRYDDKLCEIWTKHIGYRRHMNMAEHNNFIECLAYVKPVNMMTQQTSSTTSAVELRTTSEASTTRMETTASVGTSIASSTTMVERTSTTPTSSTMASAAKRPEASAPDHLMEHPDGPVPMLADGLRSCQGLEKEWGECPDLPQCVGCKPLNCIFSPWEDWHFGGGCIGLCFRQRGIALRNNECGDPCQGPKAESKVCKPDKKCFDFQIPQDCVLDDWSDWSDCQSTLQQRIRTRGIKQPPLHGGQQCYNHTQETQPCGLTIKTDCKLSEWGHWTPCHRSCGGGWRVRARRVLTHGKMGGDTCNGTLKMLEACNTMPCGSAELCSLEAWSDWRGCTFDSPHQKIRTRVVGDKPCNAAVKEVAPCVAHPVPVPCELSSWSQWAHCAVTCGGGQTYRSRHVKKPAEYGGDCPHGTLHETKPCAMRRCSAPSPDDCDFSSWSAWSVCSTTCGEGQTTRQRTISQPRAKDGEWCRGALNETAQCELRKCPPVDCEWGSWDVWSVCTATCGGGSKHRNRVIKAAPRGGGKLCEPRNKTELTSCGVESCEHCVDGRWSSWSSWSVCSTHCGDGFQVRHRDVAQQANHCGKPTTGLEDEYQRCRGADGPCIPVQDCELSAWSAWSLCSADCFGINSRHRRVAKFPSGGGKSCSLAALKEVRACNPRHGEATPADCDFGQPRPCVLADWSEWSNCSVPCGGGQQSRLRHVVTPAAALGKPCNAPLQEMIQCATQQCAWETKCVDCELEAWSDWSGCDRRCGGQRYRRRSVKQLPNHCGQACQSETALKEATMCAPCTPNFCAWVAWSSWGSCSAECGASQQVRQRHLATFSSGHALELALASEPLFQAFETDFACGADQVEVRACPTRTCAPRHPKVDCVFHDWQSWTAPTCIGLCERTRTVAQAGAHGGLLCTGHLVETKTCPSDCSQPEDCRFSMWTEWSECPSSVAQSHRGRTVLEVAHAGGKACRGPLHETRPCDGPSEPVVDCEFGPWDAWERCSEDCGGGLQIRTRHVGHRAVNGGNGCLGPLNEVRQCNVHVCPGKAVPCIVGDWEVWSNCSQGFQKMRTRSITQFSTHGGIPCDRTTLQETAVCHSVFDCVLSDWSTWDDCDKPCGDGQQQRVRTVLQAPQNGGRPCPSELHETQGCNRQLCDKVDCQVGSWSEWGLCSEPCDSGQQVRKRTVVHFREPLGQGCRNVLEEARACIGMVPCNRTDCMWGDWSQWGSCSCPCAGGQRSRDRKILKPPLRGGRPCLPLAKEEVEPCNTQPCKTPGCIDGLWGHWSDWEVCSMTCSGGLTWRSRQVVREANSCGELPLGPQREERSCNTHTPCEPNVDCKFTDWEDWSSCSQVCSGQSGRSRHIGVHRQGAGRACQGALKDVRPCNPGIGEAPPTECIGHGPPVDCVLGSWTAWGSCSASCGGGLQERERPLLMEQQNGGRGCNASLKETQACGQRLCHKSSCNPVDCLWGHWAPWMACTKCGGERKRFRHVLRHPECGGLACHPSLSEEVTSCPRSCEDVSFCAWGSWELWSACSARCGFGRRSRVRRLQVQKETLEMRALEEQRRKALERKFGVQRKQRSPFWQPSRARWLVAVFALGVLSGTVVVATWRCSREGRLPRYRRIQAAAAVSAMQANASGYGEVNEVLFERRTLEVAVGE